MPYANPATQREYQRQWAARRRAAFFDGRTCEWCGSEESLELHHRDPSQKVANAIWSWGDTRREAEIAKCIVICRTCHKRTHREVRRLEAELRHPHGTVRRYWNGCRCDLCRLARSETSRGEVQARRLLAVDGRPLR